MSTRTEALRIPARRGSVLGWKTVAIVLLAVAALAAAWFAVGRSAAPATRTPGVKAPATAPAPANPGRGYMVNGHYCAQCA